MKLSLKYYDSVCIAVWIILKRGISWSSRNSLRPTNRIELHENDLSTVRVDVSWITEDMSVYVNLESVIINFYIFRGCRKFQLILELLDH